MARKSKKEAKQQALYLGIFLSLALVAVFIFGATYGNYLKTSADVSLDPPCTPGSGRVACLNADEEPVYGACIIYSSPTQCDDVKVTEDMCNDSGGAFYAGTTCKSHGIPTPTPEPIPKKVPLLPEPDIMFQNVKGDNGVASISPEPSPSPS